MLESIIAAGVESWGALGPKDLNRIRTQRIPQRVKGNSFALFAVSFASFAVKKLLAAKL